MNLITFSWIFKAAHRGPIIFKSTVSELTLGSLCGSHLLCGSLWANTILMLCLFFVILQH